MSIDILIGAGTLATIQLVGAALYSWVSTRSDARILWESLAVVNGWWFLAPIAIARDAIRRRRQRAVDRYRAQRGDRR